MRHLALSLVRAAASRLRFAIIAPLLAFTTLPLMAQEQPIPAELTFLNTVGKPYRITYEPWTNCRSRREIGEAAGLARWREESIGSFP